jgi:hypothetical protein
MGLNSFLDALAGAFFLCLCHSARNVCCRMGFLASTPFIGAGGNNFSHIFCGAAPFFLLQLDSSCPASVQSLSECAAITVPMRCTDLFRFEPWRGPLKPPGDKKGGMGIVPSAARDPIGWMLLCAKRPVTCPRLKPSLQPHRFALL